MCRICTEWELGKLTNQEVMNAMKEILLTSNDEKTVEHLIDLTDKILEEESKLD